MLIYFDTEFSGLKKDTTLISIGLVTEDGKTYYGEFNDFDMEAYNDPWLKKNVLDNTIYLNGPYRNDSRINKNDNNYTVFGNKAIIKSTLEEFLNAVRGKEDIELVSDVCHYDMVLFIDIFGDAFHLPDFIAPCCIELNQMIAKKYNLSAYEAFDKSREDILKENNVIIDGAKHNSLYDAKVIKEIYKIVTKAEA